MAAPICRSCGSALPRSALFCPRCNAPVFAMTGRRARRVRTASLFGTVGSLVMALQAGCMLVGGGIALYALSVAVAGDLRSAERVVGVAAIFVGFALLFDLVGVAFLGIAFHIHSRAARASVTLGGAHPGRARVAFEGFLATVFLFLWISVTLAWRGLVAAFVAVYPTPLGLDLSGGVQTQALRDAAAIILPLWVAAAFLLFLGAVFGTRFLMGARGKVTGVAQMFWPLETGLHAFAALAIALVAQSVLASPRGYELSTLTLVQTLGLLDLVIVPFLGLVAYLALFREFLGMFREGRTPARPAVAASPADPPGGEG